MNAAAEPWGLLVVAILATFVWRLLGAILSTRISPDGVVIQWVTLVSYAMVAGLISRMTLIPLGALAETPLPDRVVAMAVAFGVFFAWRRKRILPAVFAGVACLSLFIYIRQIGLLGG